MEKIHFKTIDLINRLVVQETGTQNELSLVWSAYFCSNVGTKGYDPKTIAFRARRCFAQERELKMMGIEPIKPLVGSLYLEWHSQGTSFLEECLFTLMRKELGRELSNLPDHWAALAYSRLYNIDFSEILEGIQYALSLEVEKGGKQEQIRDIREPRYLNALQEAVNAYRFYTNGFCRD
ncbi:hypothetical protein [Rufibacter latericius]|uniref:Uncharacterized protein n=1 Tax=Rufibacter latericius TaxID=2487040 RepID=A0A3M9MDE8_9BACT|nr:hypothetical protein [Rufibacter latericius]RNI22618.1 hypothetical protein EFB08_21215 [Rufibacter latericius]